MKYSIMGIMPIQKRKCVPTLVLQMALFYTSQLFEYPNKILCETRFVSFLIQSYSILCYVDIKIEKWTS